MKTLQYLAAPRSFILHKQQSRRVTSKGSIDNSTGNKPSCLAHYTNDHLKFSNLQVNVAAVVPLIKNKLEKELHIVDWRQAEKLDNKKIVDMLINGRLLQGGPVFQQNFLIRSYDLGPDCKMSIRALINLLQESALNHLKGMGLIAEGFGSTPEMSIRDLIWVVCRMKIVVESYPSWDDVVQVNTWICASGRNGMRRHWLVRDYNTGKVLFRAVSVYVMMNKKTRKLSKLIEETREELKEILMDCDPIIEEDDTKLRDLNSETADYIRTGLSPQWTDLDVNQHVNNVKYIDWVLEGVPNSIVESHKLSSIRLEFRKECGKSSSLQSLCANNLNREISKLEGLELDHTIRFQNGSEILRGRTIWTPRK